MQFIELTEPTGQKVYVNVSKIVKFNTVFAYTNIHVGPGDFINVKETPNQILALIPQ